MPGATGALVETVGVFDMAGSPCVKCDAYKEISNTRAECWGVSHQRSVGIMWKRANVPSGVRIMGDTGSLGKDTAKKNVIRV